MINHKKWAIRDEVFLTLDVILQQYYYQNQNKMHIKLQTILHLNNRQQNGRHIWIVDIFMPAIPLLVWLIVNMFTLDGLIYIWITSKVMDTPVSKY